MLYRICSGVLLLALLGCGRSTVVMTAESVSGGDEREHNDEQSLSSTEVDPSDESAQTPFAFAEDAGGAPLAKELTPKAPKTSPSDRIAPPRRPASSRTMTPPALPLPSSRAVQTRRIASAKTSPLRPRLVFDETLGALTDAHTLPQSLHLPDGVRVRVASVDANRPIALPIRPRPLADRASLDDATADASTTAALSASMPPRTDKAPFLKLMRPDPFSRRRVAMPTPKESGDFPVGSPQIPRH